MKSNFYYMSERFYWENGERVPVVMPDEIQEEEPKMDSPELMMMRTLIGILHKCPHPALSIECLSLISGIGYQGKSMAQIARDNMVTRATVSRRCVDLCNLLGIPPVRAMRNFSGQENCRIARSKKLKQLIEQCL